MRADCPWCESGHRVGRFWRLVSLVLGRGWHDGTYGLRTIGCLVAIGVGSMALFIVTVLAGASLISGWARAATPTARPCVEMPDAANHRRYDFTQFTCPVLGSNQWLEVRMVRYHGKVIGMRAVKLVP